MSMNNTMNRRIAMRHAVRMATGSSMTIDQVLSNARKISEFLNGAFEPKTATQEEVSAEVASTGPKIDIPAGTPEHVAAAIREHLAAMGLPADAEVSVINVGADEVADMIKGGADVHVVKMDGGCESCREEAPALINPMQSLSELLDGELIAKLIACGMKTVQDLLTAGPVSIAGLVEEEEFNKIVPIVRGAMLHETLFKMANQKFAGKHLH